MIDKRKNVVVAGPGMLKNDCDLRPVFSLEVYECESGGEDRNFRVMAKVRAGGLSLEFDQTVDRMRQFFTERREKREMEKLRESESLCG